MDFNKYQDRTQETAVYPEKDSINYLTLGLNGESGEVAEKIKKSIRDDEELNDELRDELGDVLWYLARLADELGFTLDEIANRNLDKLLDRKNREKIQGSGDQR
jgi:NTP pyrophosphatase (non-canonical NTP hydrolase)